MKRLLSLTAVFALSIGCGDATENRDFHIAEPIVPDDLGAVMAGLNIVMTWDEGPADLDLHLVHENGTFYESPWDCYSANVAPDWGAPNESPEDPHFVTFDIVDGPGPEIIRIMEPENVRYDIFAFTFDAPDPTNVTVRISSQGHTLAENSVLMPGTNWRFHIGSTTGGAFFTPTVGSAMLISWP